MAKEALDVYPNLLVVSTLMSAANTITFKEINVGVNIFDKAGLVIARLEYQPLQATIDDLDTDSDNAAMALVSSNALANLAADQAEVIDLFNLGASVVTAAGIWRHIWPHVHDFSTLGGGGLLIPPKPLYAAMASSGMTVAGQFWLRVYFKILRLESDQYLELLETRRAFG